MSRFEDLLDEYRDTVDAEHSDDAFCGGEPTAADVARTAAARAAVLAEYRRLADACRSALPLTITGLQAVVKVFPEHASGFAELIPQLRAALAAAGEKPR